MIAWGVVLGLLIFGDEPRAHVIAGAGIIIAAGLFIFFASRESYGRGVPLPPFAQRMAGRGSGVGGE
jgi:hypothetical protein